MKTARHLLAAALVALTLASPAGAEDKTVPESDFNAYKELAQVKLDAAKESLQKDVTTLGTRVDNQDKRQADLDMATRLFEQAESEHPDKPIVLGNRAYCAHLRGEPVEIVRPLLARALKNGGEPLYTDTLDDLAIHPVPEDAAFRVLLDEVWAEVRGEDPPEAAPVAA